MNRADFQAIYAYSDNCWRVMGTALTAAPNAWNTPFETISKWNSVRLLLAHSIASEERIVTVRLKGLEVAVPYEERAAESWEGLYRDQQTVRQATYDYIASLSDSELTSGEKVISSLGGGPPLTRADALFHLSNHENYCRGEVISAIQRLGFDPPNFDYVLLKDSLLNL